MGVGGQHYALTTLPSEKTQYPLYRKLGGPQGRSGWVQKISPPPGFDPWTVQPAASCYTDYTIPVLGYTVHLMKNGAETTLHYSNYEQIRTYFGYRLHYVS
jgi:hypothetical protein